MIQRFAKISRSVVSPRVKGVFLVSALPACIFNMKNDSPELIKTKLMHVIVHHNIHIYISFKALSFVIAKKYARKLAKHECGTYRQAGLTCNFLL